MSYFNKNTPNSISAGALPQTPLGELTDPLAGLKGSLLLREGGADGREGRGGTERATASGPIGS